MLKSVGSILVGFIAVALLSVVTDTILEALGVFPSATRPELYAQWMLVAALIYRSIFAVAGGYITSRLAPTNSMRHVLILAIIGTRLGTLGTIANWSKTTPGTEWYPVLLLVFSFVAVWYGGKLQAKEVNSKQLTTN